MLLFQFQFPTALRSHVGFIYKSDFLAMLAWLVIAKDSHGPQSVEPADSDDPLTFLLAPLTFVVLNECLNND